MKRTIRSCDTCGKEITKGETRYKFKEYGSLYTYFGDTDYCNKLDMCQCCYDKLIKFVNREVKNNGL